MTIFINCPLSVEYKALTSRFPQKVFENEQGFKNCIIQWEGHKIIIAQSGMGKVNTAIGVVRGITRYSPHVIIDTGSCGAIESGLEIGDILFSCQAYEYDISGSGIPEKKEAYMEVPSLLEKEAALFTVLSKGTSGKRLFRGSQLTGEFLIDRKAVKEKLFLLFGASGCNWETAALFKAARAYNLPAFSLRLVTDRADEDAVTHYFKDLAQRLQDFYSFLKKLLCKKNFYQFFS